MFMEMNKTMKDQLVKLLKAFLVCGAMCILIAAIVAFLLRTPLLAEQKAFLYRLLAFDAIACFILLVIVVSFIVKRGVLFGLELSAIVMCVGLSTLFMALFLSLGPMPIERSYTIYSLADMADHADTVYSYEDIKRQFIEGYVEGANESQKRIDEQVYIGNLEQMDNGYQITEKGRCMVSIFRFVEFIFPVPDKNSIYPNRD